MKSWYLPVAIISGLGAAFVLLAAGAPNWACSFASGIVSGAVMWFLLKIGRR